MLILVSIIARERLGKCIKYKTRRYKMRDNSTTTGWGFEAANGMLWACGHERRKEAIAWIEKEVKQPWTEIKRDWGVRAVKVIIAKN